MPNKLSFFICQVTFALILITSQIKFVAANQTNDHAAHKSAVGVHGMALFSDGEKLYASHMPLAHSIHAHQVIFNFTLATSKGADSKQLLALIANNKLVSLMPEKFDLMELISGELKEFKATVFRGHFERGGEQLNEIKVAVNKMLLATDLLTDNSLNGNYFLLKASGNKGFLVHQIVSNPSFDQIILVTSSNNHPISNQQNKIQLVNLKNPRPLELAKQGKLTLKKESLILHQSLYLETRDFQ